MERIVAPGLPHHIVHRAPTGETIFFSDEDYSTYIHIAAECCSRHGVEVWTYCLMPDHIHLIAVPGGKKSLDASIYEAKTRYTQYKNAGMEREEEFFQEIYASHVMDERYLIACTRYIEINPVKREYVDRPGQWAFSSAAAHMAGRDDRLVNVGPLLNLVKTNWSDFLAEPIPEEEAELFYSHEKSGKPLGSEAFIEKLNNATKGDI